MPFGNESTWDNQTSTDYAEPTGRHQCLSATSPLGTIPMCRCLGTAHRVTNAFRQRVHLGHIDEIEEMIDNGYDLAAEVTDAAREFAREFVEEEFGELADY